MPGGVTIDDSGLCCCVPCLLCKALSTPFVDSHQDLTFYLWTVCNVFMFVNLYTNLVTAFSCSLNFISHQMPMVHSFCLIAVLAITRSEIWALYIINLLLPFSCFALQAAVFSLQGLQYLKINCKCCHNIMRRLLWSGCCLGTAAEPVCHSCTHGH